MEPKLLTAQRFVDLQTGCMYRYVFSETEYFRPHYHDYNEIFLVLSGTAEHLVNGNVVLLEPGDLVFIRPRDVHNYRRANHFSMLNITFTQETCEAIFSFLGKGFPSDALNEAPLPPQVRLTGGEFAAIQARMKTLNAYSQEDIDSLKTALRVLLFDLFTKYFSSFSVFIGLHNYNKNHNWNKQVWE